MASDNTIQEYKAEMSRRMLNWQYYNMFLQSSWTHEQLNISTKKLLAMQATANGFSSLY